MTRALWWAFVCCVFLLLFVPRTNAQCGFGGTNYGDVTPGFVGDTFEYLNYVWGGDQYTLQANEGCVYTVSTCGTSWDTQITIFDAAQTVVGYNDDGCGLQSQVTSQPLQRELTPFK